MLSLAVFGVIDASPCRNSLRRLKRYLLTRLYDGERGSHILAWTAVAIVSSDMGRVRPSFCACFPTATATWKVSSRIWRNGGRRLAPGSAMAGLLAATA